MKTPPEIKKLSNRDKLRLAQCLICKRDPSKCGASEKDEEKKRVMREIFRRYRV